MTSSAAAGYNQKKLIDHISKTGLSSETAELYNWPRQTPPDPPAANPASGKLMKSICRSDDSFITSGTAPSVVLLL